MGWLSSLGSIGAIAGAPFTGGASLALLPAISAIGQAAGSAAAGRAAGRQQEGQALNQRDLAANQLYGTQQNAQMQAGQLDLQRQQAAQQMQSQRAKQGVAGDLLAHMQDVNINVPGIHNATVTGGLRPSAMSATGRDSAALLAKNALVKQLQGDSFTGGTLLTPPTQSAMPQENTLDKILSGVGLGGSLLGALGGSQQGVGGGIWSGAPTPDASAPGTAASLPQGLDPNILQMFLQQNPNAMRF